MAANGKDWQTRLRLWAACVLGLYAIARMLFYASGLLSFGAMEAVYRAMAFLSFLSPLFFLAIVTHIALGLWKLYRRNSLKLPAWELCQIFFGLSLPFLLVPQFTQSYGLFLLFGQKQSYVDAVLLFFPENAWRYIAFALIVGVHAQIGLHAIFRSRRSYPRWRSVLATGLTLLPLIAIGGYLRSGGALYQAYLSGGLAAVAGPHPLSGPELELVRSNTTGSTIFFAALYVVLFTARFIRLRLTKGKRTVFVRYTSGQSVAVFPATTVLEASRLGGIPHASICGGRARCTTCRIKIVEGMENLSPVGEREQRALQRIHAAEGIRLACQAECRADSVLVTPLLPPDVSSERARKESQDTVGRDVKLAVMFADIRGFTRMSESKLPYDVVFILNRYFDNMGEAIVSSGGKIDKFLGDGILAYFGRDVDLREACRSALLASRKLAESLAVANEQLKSVLTEPLSIGIGLHVGDVILGQVGYKNEAALTIIGDTVNTASRLQSVNKQTGSQMVLSTKVAALAGVDLSHLRVAKVGLRGKEEAIRVYIVKDVLKEIELDEAASHLG